MWHTAALGLSKGALADKAIDHQSAALMLYGLQIAASNLKRFAAEQQPDGSEEGEKSLAEILLERLGLGDEEEEEAAADQQAAVVSG